MKADLVTRIVTEGGEELLNPEDGFIICGNIYRATLNLKGQPYQGLIGDNFDPKVANTEIGGVRVRMQALTRTELLKALGYTIKDLRKAIRQMERRPRNEIEFSGTAE